MVSTIGIVSLSSGIIGEDFVKHEVDLGIQRLKDLGLNPIFFMASCGVSVLLFSGCVIYYKRRKK